MFDIEDLEPRTNSFGFDFRNRFAVLNFINHMKSMDYFSGVGGGCPFLRYPERPIEDIYRLDKELWRIVLSPICRTTEAAFELLKTGMLFGIDLKTLEALKCAGNTPAWYASELATGFTTALPEDLILTAFQTRGKLPESFEAPAVPAGIQEMSAEAHAFALRWWLALKADAERAPYTSCLRYAVSLSVAHAAAEIPTVDLLAFIGHCPQAWQLRYPGSFVIREAEELKTLRGSTDDRIELARQSTHEARAIERYQQMLYLAQSGISAVRAALPVSDWGPRSNAHGGSGRKKGGTIMFLLPTPIRSFCRSSPTKRRRFLPRAMPAKSLRLGCGSR